MKKLLLTFFIIAVLTTLFAISASAQTPIETWDISATENDSVFAYLFNDEANEGMYKLEIAGARNMLDFGTLESGQENLPWSSYSSSIISVTIEEGIEKIGSYAFWNTAITEIYIPKSVNNIGIRVFESCEALKNIVVDDNNNNYKSIDGNLYTKDGKILIQYATGKKDTSFVVPHGVIEIGVYAFAYNGNLIEISLPSGLKSIGAGAFIFSNVEEFVLPNTLESIEMFAFAFVRKEINIFVSDKVSFVGKFAFGYSSSFVSVYCESASKPADWHEQFYANSCEIIWGHEHSASNKIVNNGDNHTGNCVCGITVTEAHSYSAEVTKEATHLEFGEMTYTCICSDTNTEIIGKTSAHNWTPWQENEDGTRKERSCECGETDYVEIEKEDDKEVVVKPNKPDKDKEKNQIKIDVIFDKPTLEAIGIQIIPEIIEQLNNMETEVNTDIGTVILDAIASSKLADTAATVNIGIADVTTDKEDKQGRKVFSITINDEDGNPILPPAESDDNGTITLSMKYKKGLVKEQIKIAYRDEKGKLEHMEVEKYDPETGEVTFKTTHLSDYIIYTEEENPSVYLESAFTFLGYSTREDGTGSICVGYEVDYEVISMYENATGIKLDFGVVFASYERLNGKQPLNADGTEASLEKGKVIKFGLDSYTYKNYDFVLNDITDALKDHKLVMTAYVFNGSVTKYFQGTVSETVTGISYNDISNAE